MKRFTGVLPALITPLKEDETLNVTVLHQLVNDLLKQGADGFYVGGATGEGIALRQDVREQLAEETIKLVGGRKPCIIHVASADFSEAIALAKHAQRSGADAVSAIPPLFFSYDEEDVYQYYKAIAAAVDIPVMIYFNPAAGFKINAQFAARMFEIDNVTAIKWTSSDYYGMLRVKELTHGEMNVINGPDEMLLMGLSAGADGGIGSTYNILLPQIKGIYENFKAGNIARAQEIQAAVDEIIAVLHHYPTIPCLKAILESIGYEVGNAAFPMKRFTQEQKEKMLTEFITAGYQPAGK